MSYLLDRKNKRRKMISIGLLVVFGALFIYFRDPVFRAFSGGAHTIFRPAFIVKNKIGGMFSGIHTAFQSKGTLKKENEELKLKLVDGEAKLLNYNTLVNENSHLKEILNRKQENTNLVVSAILSKPNKSPYDTLVIDAGEDHGIGNGSLVFALGSIPIGRVAEVYAKTSKVILFSTSGEKTEVVLEGMDAFVEVVGRGGGNFEITLPRDFSVSEGTAVTFPGISSYIVATVSTIISDPRDSFSKALLVSPVNIQQLKFVEVRK